MSELITATRASRNLRWRLLATVSALALTANAMPATAQDEDRPTVWIELGAQAERMPSVEERFAPAFALRQPRPFFESVSPLSLERPPRYAVGGEGKLTFEPAGSNWVFVASVRYGRSNGKKHVHDQVNISTPKLFLTGTHNITQPEFEETKTEYKETHTVLDFSAGKDVGLGLFGDVVASVGVRYAQFHSSSDVNLSSRPDLLKLKVPLLSKYYSRIGWHHYTAHSSANRNFHGIGPSLSLTGDVPIAGNAAGRSLTFDWGLNGALLFGRQRAETANNAHGSYYRVIVSQNAPPLTYNIPHSRKDTHSVTVPNIGGFAGISYRFPNAKLSAGYRADFFFGAMDKGLDARDSATVGFHGPFATVSVGLGG